MSAVLITPSIPSQYTELFKNPQFIEELKDLIFTNSEIREALCLEIDLRLIKEHNLIQRVAGLEKTTGLVDYSDVDFSEEHKPTLEERVTVLEEKKIKQVNPPQSVTDYRAHFLLEHLESSVTMNRFGETVIDKKEFSHFVTVLPEEYRVKDGASLRKIMRDVFLKAVARYPDKVSLSQNDHGNKELRLVLKCNQPEL
jgi:hypothetical protein